LIHLCGQYGITLIHSTPYYPQGNGRAKSSNKRLIKIVKKLLEDNKNACDSKLKFSLWDDRVTTNRALGLSPFQLVYGVQAVFPSQLAFPMEKFLQDYQVESDDMIRRIQELVEVQQTWEKMVDKAYYHQLKIKQAFEKNVKKEDFQLGDLVLKWDALR